MKQQDGRKLDHKTLEHLRQVACKRVENGEKMSAVMKSLGFCRTTGYEWLKLKAQEGSKGLLSKKASGPKPRLEKEEIKRLKGIILKQDPRDHGYDQALWNGQIISEIILNKFKKKMTSVGVQKLLKRIGITPRQPLRRAYERDEKKVDEWKAKTLPKIVKRAKKHKATILFLDEAGVQSDPALSKTWGAKGKRTIVKTSGQRQKINAVSAVSAQGEFKYELYSCRFNADFFIEILKKFTKRMRRSCYFIVDGHPSHKANKVKEFIKQSRGKIELYFLPPYAPDLNPDEFVWGRIKKHGISKKPLKKNESLKNRVDVDLARIKKDKALVRSFFKAQSVGYPS
jgi:transposase